MWASGFNFGAGNKLNALQALLYSLGCLTAAEAQEGPPDLSTVFLKAKVPLK